MGKEYMYGGSYQVSLRSIIDGDDWKARGSVSMHYLWTGTPIWVTHQIQMGERAKTLFSAC